MFFELNCGYYLHMFFEENINFYFCPKIGLKLAIELQKLFIICHKNFYPNQKLQKWAYKKGVKFRNYAIGEKVWLNKK